MNEASPIIAEWIAVDWGTTNLRAWAMAGDRPLASAHSDKGMGAIARESFEPALLEIAGGWLGRDRPTDIVACGMVGSRQGWVEAGYEPVPGPPRRNNPPVRPRVRDPRLNVHVLHGLKQEDPADVMRGEETQIAGFLAQEENFDGAICLPGTHSKWAMIDTGAITGFTTFMTGELFSLLGRQSVLRHTLAGEGWSQSAFEEAVDECLRNEGQVAERLFTLRAGALLGRLDPVAARARLSGLLIGMEIAAAKQYRQAGAVVLIGTAELCRSYASALGVFGVAARRMDSTAMTLAGLHAAYGMIQSSKAYS